MQMQMLKPAVMTALLQRAPTPARSSKKDTDMARRLKIGKAIDILRYDYECFMDQGLSDFSIYNPEIVFRDPDVSNMSCVGVQLYRWLSQTGRGIFKLSLSGASLQIDKVEHCCTDKLEIRWTLQGEPRLRALVNMSPKNTYRHIYTGLSEYTFDHKGLIVEHIISNVEPNPSKSHSMAFWLWLSKNKCLAHCGPPIH